MQFKQIIGHAALKARLIGNIREDRVPHAQFLMGPRGSGVLPLALAYATYLFCDRPSAGDSCGECPGCRMMADLAHPDLNLAFPIFLSEKVKTCAPFIADWRAAVLEQPLLDAEMWRDRLNGENKQLRMGVDIAAEMMSRLSLKAHQGGWKVMLVWLPEMMDPPMANKILKVLEEPEPRTVFLLAGHVNDRILPTVLSRTQLVKVSAPSPTEVADLLRERCPETGPEQVQAIAARCEGDLLEALAMAEGGEEALFILFRDWLRACYAGRMAEIMDQAEQFAKMGREKQKSLMITALRIIRQCVLQWQDAQQLVRATGEELVFVRKFSKQLNVYNAEGLRRELELAHGQLERNANPKVLFQDLSYRMAELMATGQAA